MTRFLLWAAVAAFFVAVPRLAQAKTGTTGQTFTVPQCIVAAAGQDLLADTANRDDCLLGTTGGPF